MHMCAFLMGVRAAEVDFHDYLIGQVSKYKFERLLSSTSSCSASLYGNI